MINICYIIGQLNRAGAERQLYQLVKGIDRQTFNPVVISLSQGGHWGGEIRKLNIPVIEIERRKNRETKRLVTVFRLLRKLRPDIVHTYLFSGNTYGRVAAILAGTPAIIASERNEPKLGKDKSISMVLIDRLLALFSAGIICNSRKAFSHLTQQYARKVFFVPNGIDCVPGAEVPQRRSRRSAAPKIIGTIGRLWPQKNHRLFLDVAKEIIKTEKRAVEFLLVGDGPLRDELQTYCRSLGIEQQVRFTGERADIPGLLQSMDIFVMTSLYEGMSNTIMEAMLSGLPVVATDVGGNSELVVNNETGYLVPLKDTGAMAAAVLNLIHDGEKREKMGESGRKRIVSEFGTEKMVKETEKIYAGILQQRKLSAKVTRSEEAV